MIYKTIKVIIHIKIMKYNYVYITTNLINGIQYVGDHSTNNLDDGYIGSGTYFKNAIKKYGKENFKKEILEFFDNKQDAFNAQFLIINKYNTLSPNGYNISPKGGYGISNSFLNEETKKKIGLAHKGKINKALSFYNSNNKKGLSYIDQMVKIYGENIGLEKATIYKDKISLSTSGKNNPMFGKGDKISGNKNGMFGKTHLEETKYKMKKPRSEEAKLNIKIAQQKRREKEKLTK